MGRGEFLMTQIKNIKAVRQASFGFLVQVLARDLDVRMKAPLKEVGVDIKIFANLMLLFEEDGINQRALGERLNFPEYFTSRNIDALVKSGFAERKPDPNSRRSILIFLTPKGRAKARQLPAIIKKVNDEALSELSPEERTEIVGLLKKANKLPV
jgi:DNA-binding MarR family transcriptional regulator